jgi:hypothetical protein
MGASSSVESYEVKKDGRIYKNHSKCKCIFSCTYNNFIGDKLELLYCCYDCLQTLKTKNYNNSYLTYLIKETKNVVIREAIEESNWLSEKDAILYAYKNKIDIKELLTNTNILDRYNIVI